MIIHISISCLYLFHQQFSLSLISLSIVRTLLSIIFGDSAVRVNQKWGGCIFFTLVEVSFLNKSCFLDLFFIATAQTKWRASQLWRRSYLRLRLGSGHLELTRRGQNPRCMPGTRHPPRLHLPQSRQRGGKPLLPRLKTNSLITIDRQCKCKTPFFAGRLY